jgi:hypothetical protein
MLWRRRTTEVVVLIRVFSRFVATYPRNTITIYKHYADSASVWHRLEGLEPGVDELDATVDLEPARSVPNVRSFTAHPGGLYSLQVKVYALTAHATVAGRQCALSRLLSPRSATALRCSNGQWQCTIQRNQPNCQPPVEPTRDSRDTVLSFLFIRS